MHSVSLYNYYRVSISVHMMLLMIISIEVSPAAAINCTMRGNNVITACYVLYIKYNTCACMHSYSFIAYSYIIKMIHA